MLVLDALPRSQALSRPGPRERLCTYPQPVLGEESSVRTTPSPSVSTSVAAIVFSHMPIVSFESAPLRFLGPRRSQHEDCVFSEVYTKPPVSSAAHSAPINMSLCVLSVTSAAVAFESARPLP